MTQIDKDRVKLDRMDAKFKLTYRPAVDDEDGLRCNVEATLFYTLLLSNLQVAAFLVQI